eukprot:720790_1
MASKKSALKIKDIDILRQCLKDNGSMQWKRCKPKLSKQENTRLTNAWKNDARYIQALMDPCKHQALEQLTILLHSNNRTNNKTIALEHSLYGWCHKEVSRFLPKSVGKGYNISDFV